MSVLITITGVQQAGGWAVQLSPAGDVEVPSGTQVEWTAANGTFFFVTFKPGQPIIFPTIGAHQFFVNAVSSQSGAQAQAQPGQRLEASYSIFWTDGQHRAFLDPKVIVTGP